MLAIVWTAIVLFLCNKVSGSAFFDKYCEDTWEKYYRSTKCKNFTLPNEKSDYIISNAKTIYIENANITAFNRKFINKIPDASELRFNNSTVNFTSEPVDTYHPLRTLTFSNTKINGNRNTSILQSFKYLTDFFVFAPSPTKWMEYPSIDANFFKGNRKLKELYIVFESSDKDLDVDILEDGSLDALSNLNEVYYKCGRNTHISKNLFKNNNELRYLVMEYNSIETIEKGALPSSLISLDLLNNKIRNIQGVFTNLINLEYLYLSNNKIEEINPGDFGNLEKLECLYISRNKIQNIKGIFTNLINLQSLDLSNNKIEEINSGDFGNLEKLERLHISNNKIKVLRLDHLKNIPNLTWLFASGNDGMKWEKDLETKVKAKEYGHFVV